jgi:enoyl-[acyl-carrier protein] reductase I
MAEPPRPHDPLPQVWNTDDRIGDMLRGKRGLIVGVANEHSIAFGCAAKLRAFGAEIALTYVNERTLDFVAPLAADIQASLLLPLNVETPGEFEKVFAEIESAWGGLDFLIHSISHAPRADLHGRVIDCSREGFEQAMRVSVYSFLEMARRAEPLMTNGGAILAMSYYGADKVVNNYNIMGVAKAALQAAVRYLAAELGEKRIRVYAISPGPVRTRAASGIAAFDELIEAAVKRSPEHRLVDIAEIGRVVAFLVGGGASGMTGDTIFVDGGLHNMA